MNTQLIDRLHAESENHGLHEDVRALLREAIEALSTAPTDPVGHEPPPDDIGPYPHGWDSDRDNSFLADGGPPRAHTMQQAAELIRRLAAPSKEAAAIRADETPAETLASRLIDAWCDAHGSQITWSKAVQIVRIITKLPAQEIERLLAMDEPANPPGDQRQEGAQCLQCLDFISHCECHVQPSPPPEAAAAVGEVNHTEALQLAHLKRDTSNLARCYIALAALAAPTGPQPAGGGVDEMAEAARMIVVGAMPATASGATCFVPRYQIDKLKNALAAVKGAAHAG